MLKFVIVIRIMFREWNSNFQSLF